MVYRYCSPRINARRTAEILQLGIHNHLHFLDRETGKKWKTPSEIQGETVDSYIHLTKWLEEWDYGDYEGMTLHGIQEARVKEYGDPTWDIWREGCPGGEYVYDKPFLPFVWSMRLGLGCMEGG
jgi:probable phosphoglycerate mutase